MSGIELSRVRTELRLLPHEPINQSLLVSRGPALLCNQVLFGRNQLSGNVVNQAIHQGLDQVSETRSGKSCTQSSDFIPAG